MKAYFDPEIKISAFDVISCATASNDSVLGDNAGKNGAVGKVDFKALKDDATTAATMVK